MKTDQRISNEVVMHAITEPFRLPASYLARHRSQLGADPTAPSVNQVPPDIYPLAVRLAAGFGCSHLIDFGSGNAARWIQQGLQTICVGHGPAFEQLPQRYPQAQWIDCDLEQDQIVPVDPVLLPQAALVCANVLEHLPNPGPLLRNLRAFLERTPIAILSTPDRAGTDGLDHRGPPSNPSHVREWALPELTGLLEEHGFHVWFSGRTLDPSPSSRSTGLVVLANRAVPIPATVPAGFRVVAIMTAYNEADAIVPALEYLFRQGIEVYLLDNWSSDDTVARARPYLGRGLLKIEQFPTAGASASYDWKNLLRRVEELSLALGADWTIHHDVDQERESPWPGLTLREALYYVGQLGFNCIDHVQLAFRPVDNNYAPGTPLGEHFRHFEFDPEPSGQVQRNAWKNTGQPVNLSQSGGHEVLFAERRICPFKFLQRHYPVRSQAHGERKVLRERQARWNAQERAQGWHRHYDSIQSGHNFLRDPRELLVFDSTTFHRDYLVERLIGAGASLPQQSPQPVGPVPAPQDKQALAPPPVAGSGRKLVEEEVIRLVRTHCGDAQRILELGCRSGALGERLKQTLQRPYYAGIEKDPVAVDRARRKLNRVWCADPIALNVRELGLEASSFDLLIAVNAFPLVAPNGALLTSLLPLLKVDGKIVVALPNPQRLAVLTTLLEGKGSTDALAEEETGLLTLPDLQASFRTAGLVVTQAIGILDDGIDLSAVRAAGNQLRHGRLTLTDLSRQEVIRLFTQRFVIVAKRSP